MRGAPILAAILASLVAGDAAADDQALPASTVTDGILTIDTWNARYCEFLIAQRHLLSVEAEVYNTLGLGTCDPATFAATDADAIKQQFDALAVFKNGPRFWVVSELSSHATSREAPTADFGGIEARLVGKLQVTREMREHGPTPYAPTTIQRDTRYLYTAGRPAFILDDPDGKPWVMQAYSQIVDPALTLDDLAGLGSRLKLPEGWGYRSLVLDRDLTVHPVDGTARIVQDDLQNTYDLCFEDACSYLP